MYKFGKMVDKEIKGLRRTFGGQKLFNIMFIQMEGQRMELEDSREANEENSIKNRETGAGFSTQHRM